MQEEPRAVDDPAEEARKRKARRELARARSQRRLKVIFPFLLVLVFLAYGFTTNFIPSESMEPNLKPGDHILTMRAWLAYPGGRMPARGDIIVFVLPTEAQKATGMVGPNGSDSDPGPRGRAPIGVFRVPPGDILIKRVVGLPGETLQFRAGVLYIDGKRYAANYVTLPADPDLEPDYHYAVDQPLTLGADELFVLGDNRANSEDGRFWGPLKRKDVIGRYVRVLFREGPNGPNEKKARKEEQAQSPRP